ncbi:PqqD family protein [Sphingomonas sp.]|uniref:PqqD family protein n=1 Tax=Sphingomonas sp. TaxID=28214 RepID=UPI001B23DDC1|nr:PqqD family protein [Sphingomonas sp.]MBO9714786.1 PqqD family protein [Sphingomonas sp.]
MDHFVRVADIPAAEFGDELAVMDLKSGAYLTFNRTAAELWSLLEVPRPLEALVRELAARYPAVEPDRCRSEVEALLAQLVGMGVVERRGG